MRTFASMIEDKVKPPTLLQSCRGQSVLYDKVVYMNNACCQAVFSAAKVCLISNGFGGLPGQWDLACLGAHPFPTTDGFIDRQHCNGTTNMVTSFDRKVISLSMCTIAMSDKNRVI